ncbi:IS3 family transposase [Streptomyces sp. PSAA01]|uniref:IS3 family transposase n=1 Tax=Streptomyces sp. PSAA01 TaxID=2912762 RepID=UPI0027E39BEB|nr:IS3 family transposase [Streptomyces sp. PSAA01]
MTPARLCHHAAQLPSKNPRWGFRRVHGELRRLGHAISTATARRILRASGLTPGRRRQHRGECGHGGADP